MLGVEGREPVVEAEELVRSFWRKMDEVSGSAKVG